MAKDELDAMYEKALKTVQSDYEVIGKLIERDCDAANKGYGVSPLKMKKRLYKNANELYEEFEIDLDSMKDARDEINEFYINHDARKKLRESSMSGKESKFKRKTVAISPTTKAALTAAAVTLGVALCTLFFVCIDMVENGGMSFEEAIRNLLGGGLIR